MLYIIRTVRVVSFMTVTVLPSAMFMTIQPRELSCSYVTGDLLCEWIRYKCINIHGGFPMGRWSGTARTTFSKNSLMWLKIWYALMLVVKRPFYCSTFLLWVINDITREWTHIHTLCNFPESGCVFQRKPLRLYV